MTRRRKSFAIILLIMITILTVGCGKEQKKAEEQVEFELLEGTGTGKNGDSYNNAIRVTAIGDYPVKVEMTVLAKNKALESVYFDYDQTLTLAAGESALVKQDRENVTTLKVADSKVTLLPKIQDLTKLFIIIFIINLVLYFVLECLSDWALPAHGLFVFCPTFLELLIIRWVIAWTAIGPIKFIVFGGMPI